MAYQGHCIACPVSTCSVWRWRTARPRRSEAFYFSRILCLQFKNGSTSTWFGVLHKRLLQSPRSRAGSSIEASIEPQRRDRFLSRGRRCLRCETIPVLTRVADPDRMDVTSGPTRVPVITSADAPSPSNPEDDDYLSALGTAPLTSLASNGVAPPRLTDRPPSMLPDPPNPSRKLGKRPEIESLDYDIDASTLFESDYSRQYSSERGIHVASKWVVCGLSGLMTGAIAFMLDSMRSPAPFLFLCEGAAQISPTAASKPPASLPPRSRGDPYPGGQVQHFGAGP